MSEDNFDLEPSETFLPPDIPPNEGEGDPNSVDTQQKPEPTFPKFSQLPTELRLMIWEAALPRRKLFPNPLQYTDRFQFMGSWRLPPPIHVSVCHEAREVALRTGKPSLWVPSSPYLWTWFDRNRDVIDLSHFFRGGTAPPDCVISLAHEARMIMVGTGCIQDPWVLNMFQNDKFRKSIRSIYLQVEYLSLFGSLCLSPHFVDKMFNEHGFCVIDLEDPTPPKWMRDFTWLVKHHKVKNSFWCPRHCPLSEIAKVWRIFASQISAYRRAKREVLQTWLSGGQSTISLPEDCLNKDGSIDEAKLRSCPQFANLPRVRLIITLEMASRAPEQRLFRIFSRFEAPPG